MTITSTPRNYSSAFKEVLFGLSAAATDTIECDIYDHAATLIIGRKRFLGNTSYTVNVAPYAQSQLDVTPLLASTCCFTVPQHRIVNVTLGIGSTRRSTSLNGGTRTLYSYEKLSSSPQRLTLRPHECEELAVIGEGGTLRAQLIVPSAPETPVTLATTESTAGLVVFCLVMDDATAQCEAAGIGNPMEQASFTVRIVDSANDLLTQQTYLPHPAREQSTRLCWWNNYGQIDYVTLLRTAATEVHIDKVRTLTASGYKTTACTREQHMMILSEPLDRQTAEWLGNIAAAPRVWMVGTDTFTPIDILNQTLTLTSDSLVQINLSARLTEVENLQHL